MLHKALALAALLLTPCLSHAAIFDSADILPSNSAAGGVFGEILLSDPTSEGVEIHGRYGLSEAWNVKGIIGFGSKNKKFRFGGEAIYSILPDWEGQVGLSALGSLMYINRQEGGGVQFRVAPMVHKKLETWADLPATLYISLPLYFEARGGKYTTGSQFVLGSLFDLNEASRSYLSTEVGIRLAKAESYVMVGFGYRFGELRFERRNRGSGSGTSERSSGSSSNEKEYTDADFQKR